MPICEKWSCQYTQYTIDYTVAVSGSSLPPPPPTSGQPYHPPTGQLGHGGTSTSMPLPPPPSSSSQAMMGHGELLLQMYVLYRPHCVHCVYMHVHMHAWMSISLEYCTNICLLSSHMCIVFSVYSSSATSYLWSTTNTLTHVTPSSPYTSYTSYTPSYPPFTATETITINCSKTCTLCA